MAVHYGRGCARPLLVAVCALGAATTFTGHALVLCAVVVIVEDRRVAWFAPTARHRLVALDATIDEIRGVLGAGRDDLATKVALAVVVRHDQCGADVDVAIGGCHLLPTFVEVSGADLGPPPVHYREPSSLPSATCRSR